MLRLNSDLHEEHGRQVIMMEAEALRELAAIVNGNFTRAVEACLHCKQRVIVSGIGKSGHIARKVASTLAATGTPAHFVHAAEVAHGDAGMVIPGDLLLVFSNSGDTAELQPLFAYVKQIGVTLIGVSRNLDSCLMRAADIGLLLPQLPEACTASMAPTTSSTMMLALGDALAVATMRARGVSAPQIRALHPGGDIGRRMRQVADCMHKGDRLPLVHEHTPMSQVLLTMTEKRLGMTGVLDDVGALVGIITDGDLRRHIGDIATGTAADLMTRGPKVIEMTASVEDALAMMQSYRISVLFVVADAGSQQPIGAVQIFDIANASAPKT